MNKKINLSGLVKKFGGELSGLDVVVTGISPVSNNLDDDNFCTFIAGKKYLKYLPTTKAVAVVVASDMVADVKTICPKLSLIIFDNPYFYFSQVFSFFQPRRHLQSINQPIHAFASSATISISAVIDNFVTVGSSTIVKDRVEIYAGCYIGSNVVIGNNTVIYPNVTIMDKVKIGDNCIIHSGAVIGADGFGNAVDDNNKYHKIPQIGGVCIGDDVEIGANTTIDSGTFTPTIIGDGVRIDNLVMIAHNVKVGANVAIAACAGIAGSAVIGDNCVIAGSANITGHITVAAGTMIGGGSSVGNNISKVGVYSSGFPAMLFMQWAKLVALFKKLPELVANHKQLVKTTKGLVVDFEKIKLELAQIKKNQKV